MEFEGDFARRWKRQHVTESLLSLADAIAARGGPGDCLRPADAGGGVAAALIACMPELA